MFSFHNFNSLLKYFNISTGKIFLNSYTRKEWGKTRIAVETSLRQHCYPLTYDKFPVPILFHFKLSLFPFISFIPFSTLKWNVLFILEDVIIWNDFCKWKLSSDFLCVHLKVMELYRCYRVKYQLDAFCKLETVTSRGLHMQTLLQTSFRRNWHG